MISLKLPDGEWINLTQIRRLQIEIDNTASPLILVTWANGDHDTYRGCKALAIAEAFCQTPLIDKTLRDLAH